MMPDWYVRLSAATGPAFIPPWSNADVVVVALASFALFFVLAALTMSDWPGDVAFLSLVAGGVTVTWPAMLVLTMAAIAIVMIVSFLHAALAPGRSARIAAEAQRSVGPALDAFVRDAGLDDAARPRRHADGDTKP
jgi:hypothetical protein